MVSARSLTEMPVVVFNTASTDMAKFVPWRAVLSETMSGNESSASRDVVIGAQMRPRP